MENVLAQKFSAKSLLRFTTPSMVMMIFVAVFSITGSILAANYININALSAINIVFPFISAVLAISIMFATGANAIIAANLGARENGRARENFSVMFLVGTGIAILLTLIVFLFCDPIMKFLGSSVALDGYARIYFKLYAVTFVFLFWQVFSQYFFVTIGKPTFGLVINMAGGLICVISSYILVGVMKIGIAGAGIGVLLGNMIPGMIFALYFALKRDCILHFVKPKWHKGFLLHTCFNGSSEMVTNLAIAVVTAVMNLLMKKLAGDDGIAAVSVIVQVQFLLNSMYIGLGAGVAPIFAYAQGEDNRLQTRNVFKLSVRFTIISSLVMVLLCIMLSQQIVSAFISPDSTAFELAKTGFLIFASGYLFAGFNIFASVFFTSVSNGKISALISFLRTFAFILGMLIVLPYFLGTTGVWLAIPIAEFLAIIVSVLLLKKHRTTYHY